MRAAIAWLAVAACYRPASEAPCTVTCGVGVAACPSGQACVAGLCRGPGVACAPIDAATDIQDALPDTPVGDACPSYGTGLFTYLACVAPTPLVTMPTSFNTDNECTGASHFKVPTPNGLVCVVFAWTIDITSGGLVASGSEPLVLVGDTIQIAGAITVAGNNAAGAGFGCDAGVAGTTSGGGAGGTAGTSGGDGGPGSNATASARPVTGLTAIRGGCPGGDGDLAAAGAGAGGPGGGVIYMIGATQIGLASNVTIAAGGAGGAGGATGGGGGGGGGAGGLVAFDTPMLVVDTTDRICANGGGGGGGGSSPMASVQGDGSSGAMSCTLPRAGGGAGVDGGGPGGDGDGGGAAAAGSGPMLGGGGGGGGGGGAGWVRVFGTSAAVLDADAIVSPPAQ